MKWLYIICAALGGIAAAGLIVQRTSAYFHEVSVALSRSDLDFDILLIYGLGFGLLFVPLGIVAGLLVAFVINRAIERFSKRHPVQSDDDMEGGASWVTRRRRPS